MGKFVKKNVVAKNEKKMSAKYAADLKKFFTSIYSSAKNLHSDFFERLSTYLGSSFGYAPGRGQFPDEGKLFKFR